MRPRFMIAVLAVTLSAPVTALACFDATQCARDAQMQARMVSREVSQLAAELRMIRAERNAISTDIAALRETLAKQARRIDALEEENAALRDHVGLPRRNQAAEE